MAVKAAARNSDQDTGQAIGNYYHDRFLERVFSETKPAFILKGGRGMLARRVTARHTRDTDFAYGGTDVEEAVSELKRVATIDLDDFLEFRFMSAERIAEDQEYRDGCNVIFTPVLGGTKTLSDISIDLVVDQIAEGKADLVVPASRLCVEGLPVFDYLVYPVTSAMADKVCAIMQKYSGDRESSRVRDLVDLIVYITTGSFNGSELSQKITVESHLRKMNEIKEFRIPSTWPSQYESSFIQSAREAKLPVEYQSILSAEQLAKAAIDPVFKGDADGRAWFPSSLEWK